MYGEPIKSEILSFYTFCTCFKRADKSTEFRLKLELKIQIKTSRVSCSSSMKPFTTSIFQTLVQSKQLQSREYPKLHGKIVQLVSERIISSICSASLNAKKYVNIADTSQPVKSEIVFQENDRIVHCAVGCTEAWTRRRWNTPECVWLQYKPKGHRYQQTLA